MRVYRLEDSQNELPLHWSYQDAWSLSEEGYTDNRRPGFQVWSQLCRVISVTAGEATADGSYDATDYQWFHVIEVSDIHDGADEWYSVKCSDVKSVKVVETAKLIDWCKSKWESNIADGYDAYEENFEAWCKDSEEEISEWLNQNTIAVSPVFVETLENPFVVR